MSAAVKSPLRYPGGKQRQAAELAKLVPAGPVVSPFVGGGSVELELARRGHEVRAFDLYSPLVTFWRKLLADPVALADHVQRIAPPDRVNAALVKKLKAVKHMHSNTHRAAAFYVVNRCSFSGSSHAGGLSPDFARYTQAGIDALRTFYAPNLTVGRAHFQWSLRPGVHDDHFIFADPPYLLGKGEERLYGARGRLHKDFNFNELARLLLNRDRWLLTFNDCDWVRDTFAGCKFMTGRWSYSMSRKQGAEVVVTR